MELLYPLIISVLLNFKLSIKCQAGLGFVILRDYFPSKSVIPVEMPDIFKDESSNSYLLMQINWQKLINPWTSHTNNDYFPGTTKQFSGNTLDTAAHNVPYRKKSSALQQALKEG